MKYFLSIIFLLIIFGCKEKKQEKSKEQIVEPEMSIVLNHKKPKALQPQVKEQLKGWKQYNNIESFLVRFENISPREALNNANELKTLIQELKKDTSISELTSDAYKARINVLENEILRLFDMTLTPSISAKSVNNQVDKIYVIFGSLNTKINTVFMQKRYNEEIDLSDFFTLDSLEIKENKFKRNKRFTLEEDDD